MKHFRNTLLCLAAFSFCGILADQTYAQGFNSLSLKQYEIQLNAILLTTREVEKEFISEVVKLVGDGKLSRKVVDTSFQWARVHRPNTKYPFIYFEHILRLQGKKLKMPVPPFDYASYNRRRATNKTSK